MVYVTCSYRFPVLNFEPYSKFHSSQTLQAGYTIIGFGVECLYFLPTIWSSINIELLLFRYKYIFRKQVRYKMYEISQNLIDQSFAKIIMFMFFKIKNIVLKIKFIAIYMLTHFIKKL